jgi:site-specific recombinase XerD
MSVLEPDQKALATIIDEESGFDEAQIAAAAFLARYTGRTLEAYRFDLRTYFQWAADVGLTVLEAKRPHIELYRTAMEQKGLAPSTIDRRLSTVCGFLPIRPHRRACHRQPGPVRPAPQGPPF